jgi:proteasome lid subunit RPN8/RPN11
MSTARLEVAQDVLQELRQIAEAAYPHEAVALLAGRESRGVRYLTKALKVGNASSPAERRRRYRIAPNEYAAAERLAEEARLELLGVFHSHPDHPAIPSETDRDWAWPWFTYLVMSVTGGRAAECRAWRIREDRSAFEEEPLAVMHVSVLDTM